MSGISKIIGERIRNHRNRKGLKQEELTERCGLHATYIVRRVCEINGKVSDET